MNIYEHITKLCGALNQPIFFEIGAHKGLDTARILKLLPNLKNYHAFEPDPRNIDVFRTNITDPKVHLHETAIGNANGKTKLHLSSGIAPGQPPSNWSYSNSILPPKLHLQRHPWCKFDTSVEVNVIKLDLFCALNSISHIDFMWVDIQGAECEMIRGGQNILKNTKYIYMECEEVELYEGEIGLQPLMKLLPGSWKIIEKYHTDVLVENNEL